MTELGSTPANLWHITPGAIDISRGAATTLTIDARPKPVTLAPAATALIVIDMQNAFCRARPHETAAPPTAAPIAPLQRLVPKIRRQNIPIIWLNWGNRADKLNLSPTIMYGFARDGGFRPPLMDKGSHDASIVEELEVAESDIHVDKFRISGFWDSQLDSVLRNMRRTTLLFAGVNIDQCVNATLTDAHCLGYDCILLSDCCATRSPEFCTQSVLYNVERGMGFVTDSEKVMAAL